MSENAHNLTQESYDCPVAKHSDILFDVWMRLQKINGVKRVWDGILRSLRIESNGYLIENLPDPEIRCACGSGYSYERCCRKYHLGTSSPRTAVELLRARYSAYAYRSPSYVMRTTHWDHEDAARNKKIWKQDLLEFCDDYSFLGLKVLEQRMADHKTTFILFRVDLKTELGKRISFVERGKFLFERGRYEDL